MLLTVKQCHEAKIEPIACARKDLVFGRVPLQKGGVRLASAVGASGENSALFRVLQVRKTSPNALEIAKTSADAIIAPNVRACGRLVVGRVPLKEGRIRLASAVGASEDFFSVF